MNPQLLIALVAIATLAAIVYVLTRNDVVQKTIGCLRKGISCDVAVLRRGFSGEGDALRVKSCTAFANPRCLEREQDCLKSLIEGCPCPARHKVSMSFHAFRPENGEAPRPMTTPTLNEARTYGSDFSRGMRLAERNKVSLHVSGTASVDELGRTAHPGNLDAQVDRMLLNVSVLLERDGATFGDVVTAITYLQSASMAPRYFEILEERGLNGFPHAVVEARVCRPDLLCEMEVQAAVPS
jgi:enamine deaminase RidA (YjgF/YER057c/UK114 family)